MTAYPLGDLEPIPTRPGMRGRNLIGTEHGVTSFFISDMVIDQGSGIPLHSHPIEEVFVVTEGELALQLGDEVVVAAAESVVRIPQGVPHAVRNERPEPARALAGAAWSRATFFRDATTYLEGQPRE